MTRDAKPVCNKQVIANILIIFELFLVRVGESSIDPPRTFGMETHHRECLGGEGGPHKVV